MSLRVYRTLLALSLVLNALLISAFWAYVHFEGLWSIISTAVSILG